MATPWPKPVRRRKKRRERIPLEVVEAVFRRDLMCVAAAMDSGHRCYDAFSNPHAPDDFRRLTLEHVPEAGKNALSKKAPDDPEHLVLMCHRGNMEWGPTHREEERAWLRTR